MRILAGNTPSSPFSYISLEFSSIRFCTIDRVLWYRASSVFPILIGLSSPVLLEDDKLKALTGENEARRMGDDKTWELVLVLLLTTVEEAGTSFLDFFGVIGKTELARRPILKLWLLTAAKRALHCFRALFSRLFETWLLRVFWLLKLFKFLLGLSWFCEDRVVVDFFGESCRLDDRFFRWFIGGEAARATSNSPIDSLLIDAELNASFLWTASRLFWF